MRRPVLIGAGLGLLVTMLTWVLAQTLLGSLEQYGEKLEAVVGLVAIAVLLLITNWFFHQRVLERVDRQASIASAAS